MCASRLSRRSEPTLPWCSAAIAKDIMLPQLSLRTNPGNPNHHLWNNNGTWFVHYVVHPTPITKERVRRSLKTKCVHEARALRDALLAQPSRPAGLN
jgi:hypothetical protein